MLCDYGCGNEANYTMSSGKKCCSKHYNSCTAMKEKNSNGVKKAHTSGMYNGNDYSHLDEARKNSIATKKNRAVEKLVSGKYKVRSNGYIKQILFDDLSVPQECQLCGTSEWQGVKIPLELDHIDGDSTNNTLENLRILCPNCHSITPTWRGRNKNYGSKKVSDEELLTALKNCSNIRQALIEVGLAPKGGNYSRAKKLKDKKPQ